MSKKKSSQPKSHEQSDVDSGWKDALQLALDEMLQLLFPGIHAEVDWSRPIRFLDKELREVLRDLKQGKRAADLLVEVHLKSGESQIHHLHTEVQAEWEASFSERVYHYNYRFGTLFKRPVSSLVIYADSNPNWKPDCFKWQSPAGNTANEFRFDVAKILDFGDRRTDLEALVAEKNGAALVVLAQLNAIDAKGSSKKKLETRKVLIRRMFEAGFDREKIINLFRILDHILFLKPPEKLTFRNWLASYLEEETMPLVSTFDTLCEEREEKGRKEGRLEFAIAVCEKKVGVLSGETRKAFQQLDEESLLDLTVFAAGAEKEKDLLEWIENRGRN